MHISETDFLARETARAKAAAGRALSDASHDLMRGLSPVAWTEQHPWIGLASAAVAGFVAASAIVPSAEDQIAKKLAKLERAVDDATHNAPRDAGDHHDGSRSKSDKSKRGWIAATLATIGPEIIKLAKPILMSAITGANPAAEDAQDPATDDPAQASTTTAE